MFLSEVEAAEVDASVARLEARAEVQVVTAVVGKADAYPELPWMDFAPGAAQDLKSKGVASVGGFTFVSGGGSSGFSSGGGFSGGGGSLGSW